MTKTMRFFGVAPYLGRDQEVSLDVRFCERELLKVTYTDGTGADRVTITADLTGKETPFNLNTDCVDALCEQYEDINCHPPTKLLVMTWEKALNDVLRRALRCGPTPVEPNA